MRLKHNYVCEHDLMAINELSQVRNINVILSWLEIAHRRSHGDQRMYTSVSAYGNDEGSSQGLLFASSKKAILIIILCIKRLANCQNLIVSF